ncbi:MAG: RHS repeat-associated core domain-containing protein [Chloroflexi bacterium]|nr:RHS repeat-associated core domain-containing protein [Chloroflexota bacterium]
MVNGKLTITRYHYFTITWVGNGRLPLHALIPVPVQERETAVIPSVNMWYRFIVEVEDVGGTAIRVKVWQDGTTEPATWQIDATDSSSPLTSGTFGLWAYSSGSKYWDDLAVEPLNGAPASTATPTNTPDATATNTPDATSTPTATPDPGQTEPVVIQRSTYGIAGQAIALRVVEKDASGAVTSYYTHSDHLGSTSAMSDNSGTLVDGSTSRFAPFGSYRTEPTADLTDRGFTGHKENRDVGLTYMNARFYLPGLNRFASADSIVPQPTNPQSFNRYTYTLNNPLKFTDPSGHTSSCSGVDSNGQWGVDCDQWMLDTVEWLRANGGADGVRLAELFDEWHNSRSKHIQIMAGGDNDRSMFVRDTGLGATITVGKGVINAITGSTSALFGHELEHVSQGVHQAWSIQGELLAYQTEYRIRDAAGIAQSSRTSAAMSGDGRGSAYDPNNINDLLDARSGFLNTAPYNTPLEPTLPWGKQITYTTVQTLNTGLNRAVTGATAISDFMAQGVENGASLVTNIADWISNQ